MSVGSWLRGGAVRTLFGPKGEPQRLNNMRFCLLDVDVTGISIRRDKVTGVAVLPLVAGMFRVADLRYFTPAKASATLGYDGVFHPEVDAALKDLIAGSPIVTYNAHFVRQMMRRACPATGRAVPEDDWVDLASAAGVVAREDKELTSMGYWLEKMSAGGRRFHDATYDVFSMAQMLQVLLAYCEDAGLETLESLIRLQHVSAWLRRIR